MTRQCAVQIQAGMDRCRFWIDPAGCGDGPHHMLAALHLSPRAGRVRGEVAALLRGG
jgi:hypothetical protein